MPPSLSIAEPSRHEVQKGFGGGYSRGQRALECAGLVAFALLELRLAQRVWGGPPRRLYAWPVAVLFAFASADLLSGVVHWACDSWGSAATPVLGRSFIRTFREHHFDAAAITRHDFVETNGANALVGLPPLAAALFLPIERAPWAAFAAAYLSALALFVAATSQIHKWAHAASVPRAVAWLQRAGVVLSPAHHDAHHRAPHVRHYCITAGWCDALLERARVFARLERLISALTGARPRADDAAVLGAKDDR